MDFSSVTYIASTHAIESYMKRASKLHLTFEEAKKEILQNMYEAQIVIENETHRYLKHKKLYYPCLKIVEGNKIIYLARTTLTQLMVEYGGKFDELLEKYKQTSN